MGDLRRKSNPHFSDSMTKPPRPFIVPVFIPHAGCPHRCVFCDQRRTTGQTDGIPDLKIVMHTITTFLRYRRNRANWSEISFYGGNFLGLKTADRHALLAAAATFVRQGDIDGIRFSTRPDTIDTERLASLEDFPVTTIEVGVQSLCDHVLALNQRGHTAAQAEEALHLLRTRTNYTLGVQLMVGLPGDQIGGLLATGSRMAVLKPDFVRIYPTLVLRGSRLANWFAQGRFTPHSLEQSLEQTRSLYEIFYHSHIPVIRMGLQPTAELSPSAGVAAGPFHPSYGELVVSGLWRDAVLRHLQQYDTRNGSLTIRIHPRSVSRLIGQHRRNLVAWKSQWPIQSIEIVHDPSLPENLANVNEIPCPMIKSSTRQQ